MAIKLPKKVGFSNKAQTLLKAADKDYKEQSVGSEAKKVLTPFIDKISIVVTPKEEDAGNIFNAIWSQADNIEVFQDAPGAKLATYKFAKRICLECVDTIKYRPIFQMAYAHKQTLKLRLEFNPRKLGPLGMEELKTTMVLLLPGGWEYVIERGRITRLDVAVDFPDARPSMFALLPQQGLTSMQWKSNGKLETFVLGKKHGNQTVLYN